jgi:hypothetical protein
VTVLLDVVNVCLPNAGLVGMGFAVHSELELRMDPHDEPMVAVSASPDVG